MLLDHAALSQQLKDRKYFADEGLLTAIRLATALGRPLLLEGEPGVGKTQISHVLADALGREL
ncbi:MAG TPA: MoxR family ATPase, partial [Asanoa sp.]|nr:MoxR family ATPase [Asanoa sp.]